MVSCEFCTRKTVQSFVNTALHVSRCTHIPCSNAVPWCCTTASLALPHSPCATVTQPQLWRLGNIATSHDLCCTFSFYTHPPTTEFYWTKSLSFSASHHFLNRARRSCACGCDSEEGARVTEAWPQEEPDLGGGRGGSVAGCVWRGIQRTAGSSPQKSTWTVGCPARPSGAWPWAVLVEPG